MHHMHAFLLPAVAALSLLAALSGGGQAQAVRIRHVYFNLATQPYTHLYTQLETLLKAPSNPPYHPRDIDGRYVLGPRRSVFKAAPLGWIMLHVTAGPERGPANSATLALAEDDLYLFGFANGTNQWYFLENFASGVQGATTLPFSLNYGDIIDGGHKSLWKVPLGKGSAVYAATTMATYDRARSPTPQIKDAFARSIVMYSEAIRFKPIRMAFSNGDRWEHRTYISDIQATWIAHWGQMSTLLIAWERSGRQKWGAPPFDLIAESVREDIHVGNPAEALVKLDFILRPTSKDLPTLLNTTTTTTYHAYMYNPND
ncbi:hypothetical protein PAHAL_6G176000 [Panicum hallii]|uniref:rRNA N-glycosylase n=1 Tax=Panicum hallii TaxID=206008 RepID=A0A2S3I238_9POAL|nr:60 kDa jasmonate-induced protein-like [Panicum hallii]PAN35054.1 hypothetical protein PAHAL_6G176000 [Panicum hallii]